MAGINQLGGAQVVTGTTRAPSGEEGAATAGPQTDSGVEVASSDGVQGIEESKRIDESSDGRSEQARSKVRSFARLANESSGRSARVDEKTGDVISISRGDKVETEQAEEAAEARQASRAEQRSSKKEQLKRALQDLFARPPARGATPAEAESDKAEAADKE